MLGQLWRPPNRRRILHQELYIGVQVFNRRKFRKHTDTGRHSSVLTA